MPRQSAIRDPKCEIEALEPRTLLAFSGSEVELAELINRARANPTAEAGRLSLDFTAGLTLGEQALLVPHEPLALNAILAQSARNHALDMASRNFFDHTNPDNLSPTDRAHIAGYSGTAGENIGAGYATVNDLYQYWMSSPDERRNILSLNPSFDAGFHYDDIGIGLALNISGAFYPSYFVADFGNPTTHAPSKLIGVVFNDANSNSFYNAGEGLTGIRIDVFAGSSATGSPTSTFTTDATGNYQLPLANGSYTVRFTRLSDGYLITKPAVINNQNLEVSAKASEFAPPPPPPDDYASSGQWSLAAAIPIDSSTHSGSLSGALQTTSDSDLFSFVAPSTGVTTISGLPTNAAFNARLRIYNASGTLLSTTLANSPSGNASRQISLTGGATYFTLIDAGVAGGTGPYTLRIDGPGAPPPPPPSNDDFPDAGDWSHAAPIAIDPTTGDGSRAGLIETAGDSDLFTFVASQSGDTIFFSYSASFTVSQLHVYDANHALIGFGTPSVSADSETHLSLTAGQTYFVLIDCGNSSWTDSYGLTISGANGGSWFPPPADDLPNPGQWAQAAPITITPIGSGSRTGRILSGGDADLFTFIAARTGDTTLSATVTAGTLASRIRIFDAAGSLIATGTPGSNPADSSVVVSLSARSRYYILIDSPTLALTGNYTVDVVPLPSPYLVGNHLPVTTTYYGNKPVISFINQSGRPVVAIRSALGTWSWYTDLVQASGAPEVNANSSIPTWVDPADNLLYAAASSPSGLLLFRRAADGTWTYRNLTAEIHVSRPIVSAITTFVNPAGLRQIAGLDANGHMVSYWMTGQMWPQGWRYYFVDLATRDLVYNNHAMPAISGTVPISSYATRVDTVNIIAATDAGAVILFYRASGGLGQSLWNWANLTRITGAPSFLGALTASETSTGIVNISGTDASGHLWMITWRAGQGWRAANVSSTATGGSGGPPSIVAGSITSWINTTGQGFAAALTTSGDIAIYRYSAAGNQNTWTLTTIASSALAGLHPTGPLRAATLPSGAILITAATSAGEAMRITFTPGQTWSTENISELLAP